MARLPRLPDLLTTANLSCGVGSILLASQGQLTWACWLVFIGAAFDVLDGLAARALGGGSELGKQLDSLADMVTFGVAPGILVGYGIFSNESSEYVFFSLANSSSSQLAFFLIPVLIIPIASAWRLAKFNIDARQSSGFIGLPTPANALFWAAFTLVSLLSGVVDGPLAKEIWFVLIWQDHVAAAVLTYVIVLSALMLSELPLPSLKFKHMGWKGNQVIYLLIGMGAVLIALYGILAVPLILIIYLLSPLWGRLFPKTQEN